LEILFESSADTAHLEDPFPTLLDRRELIPLQAGVFSYQGGFLQTIEVLDAIFRYHALEMGAIEQSFGTTLPLRSLFENGYLGAFSHQALFVAPLQRRLSEIRRLAEAKTPEEKAGILAQTIDDHGQVLSPVVCYHCFETLRGSCLSLDGSLFTACARCHRRESEHESLVRLQTFLMREVIFFGRDTWVDSVRMNLIAHLRDLLLEWGIRFRIVTAYDPFFAGGHNKRLYQSYFSVKYECQLLLPHIQQWVAVASFNNHHTTLTRAYKICGLSGSPIHSGCVGYGYERLAYGLYCQLGSDLGTWPEALRSHLIPARG